MSSSLRTWFAAMALAALGACGGGGDASGPGAPGPGGLPDGVAVRLEVTPAALLLTASGQRQTLGVRALDAQGTEVRARVSWRSSRPEQVGIGSTGEVEALTALGASQIRAEVGSVRSAPVLVSVASPVPGVVLLSDSQVAGEPQLVDPQAESDIDNPYEVLLTGISAPAPGTLMLGREGKAVGGEVISSQVEGTAVRVRLRIVPIQTLMQTAQINEVLDYSGLVPDFGPEIRAGYDITQVDGEFIFTPKVASGAGRERPSAITEFKLGPYKCDFATPELPVSLGQPAQFSMKFEPRYEVDFDREAGLRKLILRSETSFKTKLNLTLSAGGVLNLDCAAPLYTRVMPLPGWAGLILTGEVKAGLGFELEGNLTIPLLGAELTSETKGPLELGLVCAEGDCKLLRNYDPVNSNQLRFITPDGANIRTDLFLYGYGFAKLKAGATLLEALRMDVVTARSGLKLEGSFAPPSSQVAPAATDYKSDYKLAFLTEVVAGSINKAGESTFRKLLMKLGIFKFNLLKFQNSVPLATSPKGTVSVDRGPFADGDAVGFSVALDPASVVFPFVGYNVARVLILRSVPGQPAREVARLDAAAGQTRFDLTWLAQGTAGEVGGEFFAFVETRLPTPFDLELGKAVLEPGTLRGRFTARLEEVDPDSGPTDVSFGSRSLVLDAEVEHDGAFTLNFLRKSASQDLVNTQRQPSRGQLIGNCAFVLSEESSFHTVGWVGLPPDPFANSDRVMLQFQNGNWILGTPSVFMGGNTVRTVTRKSTPQSGDCTGVELPGSSVTERTVESSGSTFSTSVLVTPPVFENGRQVKLPVFKSLSGPIGTDANGRRTIKFEGSVPRLDGQSLNVTLDLTEGPSTTQSTDLVISLIAPPFTEPEAPLTYAVNLHNRGAVEASAVRAEFSLPEGFTLVGTTGWQACTVLGTTVTCGADMLSAGEQRAFLVDVKAPLATGRYTVKARVAALQLDTNSADNAASATTEILD